MFKLIGAIIKYSLLVLTILVLSHIVEIQGITISQHVLNGMHLMSGYSPKKQVQKIQEDYSKSLQSRMSELNKLDAEVSPEDQKALNQVIEKSRGKK
jgi:hypothetical protein